MLLRPSAGSQDGSGLEHRAVLRRGCGVVVVSTRLDGGLYDRLALIDVWMLLAGPEVGEQWRLGGRLKSGKMF